MAATLSATVVDGSPGNQLVVAGSGLSGGDGANVTLSNQGVTAAPGLTPSTITLPSVFAEDGSSVTVTLPDGMMSGTLTVTASDATTTTCALRARSQYVQSSEYLGEGEDVSYLAPGELDVILRRASAIVDAYMGDGIRQLQVLERPKYHPRPDGPPCLYPFRTRGRKCPIISVDQLVFVSAKDLVTVFHVDDMYVNQSLNYIEILAYAIGNYALLGELEVIGYSANVLELSYTSGYPIAQYPSEICTSTAMIATWMLNRRKRQNVGMGAFSEQYQVLTVDKDGREVWAEAKRLLSPYIVRAMA